MSTALMAAKDSLGAEVLAVLEAHLAVRRELRHRTARERGTTGQSERVSRVRVEREERSQGSLDSFMSIIRKRPLAATRPPRPSTSPPSSSHSQPEHPKRRRKSRSSPSLPPTPGTVARFRRIVYNRAEQLFEIFGKSSSSSPLPCAQLALIRPQPSGAGSRWTRDRSLI